jgi:rod shape-determining protein MreC
LKQTLPRRPRDLVLVAVLLAVPLIVLRANLRDPAALNGVDRAIVWASAPLEHGLTGAARWVGDLWSRYVALVGVKADNERLKVENERLTAEANRLRLEAARAGELEKLLGLRRHVTQETLAAHVVGGETSSFFRVVKVRLDRGDLEVKPGMAVLAPAGVVGRVERVVGRYSDVMLLSDPRSAIDVVVPRTGGRGILRGVAGDQRYKMRLEYVLRDDEVKEGDEIVTSGLGGFPRNHTVGKVVKVDKKEFGLYQEVEVQPVVDFGRLRQVLVVLHAPPLEEAARR